MFNERQEAERRDKIVRVVKCFLETNGSMREISEKTKVPKASVQRYLNDKVISELLGSDVYELVQEKIKRLIQEDEIRANILKTVKCFMETNGSMEKISQMTNFPTSNVQRYLNDGRIIELCGEDTYNFIQNKLGENKHEALVKGGKNYVANNESTKDEIGKFTGSRKK